MAISFIGSANTVDVNVATFDITLPTCLEDDIVIVVIGSSSYASDQPFPVTTSGYTEVADLYADDTRDVNSTVSWKRMGATPDTIVTCTGRAGSSSYGVFGVAYVLRGVDSTTALDVTTTTDTGINSAIPDCPAITPITAGAWVVICGVCSKYGAVSITAPSGYSNTESAISTSDYGGIAAIASKIWSGSGAEDPGVWTGIEDDATESWTGVTLALRPELSDGLVVTLPVINSELGVGAGLEITLPVLAALFAEDITVDLISALPIVTFAAEARGNSANLSIALPKITFRGALSQSSWLAVTLPPLESELFGGTGFATEVPFPEIIFSAVTGATSTLDVGLPELTFSSQSGSLLSSLFQPLEVLFSGTTGTVGRLLVDLPPFAALFEADVQGLAQLVINLPSLQSVFTTDQEIISNLVVEFPTLSSIFSAPVGVTSSLEVSLPALSALLTSYEEITGQLVVVLPALRTLLEASQTGRFDTATATQLDGVILKWRRPV